MTSCQVRKQFQLAGTRTSVARKLRRKISTGLKIAWWTKWWDRMESEALSSAELEQQMKVTPFMSVSNIQDLHEAHTQKPGKKELFQ
jgi:hypothetical protein